MPLQLFQTLLLLVVATGRILAFYVADGYLLAKLGHQMTTLSLGIGSIFFSSVTILAIIYKPSQYFRENKITILPSQMQKIAVGLQKV